MLTGVSRSSGVMMKSTKFLEDLSKLTGKSDRQLAAQLGMSSAAISHYRTGKRIMDNEACLAVALALGIDPGKVIMAADMDKAERLGQHSLWEVFIQRTAAPASAVLMCMMLAGSLSISDDANAADGSKTSLSASVLRWMRKLLRFNNSRMATC